jgi:hypothetical protein
LQLEREIDLLKKERERLAHEVKEGRETHRHLEASLATLKKEKLAIMKNLDAMLSKKAGAQ